MYLHCIKDSARIRAIKKRNEEVSDPKGSGTFFYSEGSLLF